MQGIVPVSQTDVNVFAAVVAMSTFALLGLLAWRLAHVRPHWRGALFTAAFLIAAGLGLLVHDRVVLTSHHASLNAVQLLAFTAGIGITTLIIIGVLLVPVPGYKPAYVRIGLALIIGSGVFSITSFIAHEYIVRLESGTFPYTNLCMSDRLTNGTCARKDTYVWFEPSVGTRFTVGESQYLQLIVHAEPGYLPDPNRFPAFASPTNHLVPNCTLKLTARLGSPEFDQVNGDDDPITIVPGQTGQHYEWSWIITPKNDGSQLLYLRSEYELVKGDAKACRTVSRGIAYSQFERVAVTPLFLTVAGIPQWLGIIATVVGIASATFGMIKRTA